MTPTQIRALRDKLRCTQDEFAAKLGLSSASRRSFVAHLESGRRVPVGPMRKLLEKLFSENFGKSC